MRINFTILVAANVSEAMKRSKKRRPTSTPTETYLKVNQQALLQKINALYETLRLQECFVEKLSNKGTHNRNKRWESKMKSKHLSSNAFNGRPPSTRTGKTLPSLATWERRIGRNKICSNLNEFFFFFCSWVAFNLPKRLVYPTYLGRFQQNREKVSLQQSPCLFVKEAVISSLAVVVAE